MSDTLSMPAERKHAHPVVFLFLVLPFGIVAGYVGVSLEELLSNVGVSSEAIAALVAASLFPHTIKFLWAPLVDTTFSLKKWYLASCILTSVGIFAMGVLPIAASSIPLLTLIGILANVAASFLGIVTNGLAAYDTPSEMKGRVGGYSQAGNLGGAGIGGGIGLWLALHLPKLWMSSAIVAASSMLCALALIFIKEQTVTVRAEKAVKTIQNLLKDIWATVKVRIGFLALFLCFLPLGTGAAGGLWAAVASDWKASPDTVAFVTGIMGGIITAVGCLIGGWICDRMNRQLAYLLFGLVSAVSAVAMAYSPHTELMYIIWTSVYAFIIGFCYAAFSAFVFEAIGKGAAATKFTVYACLSNIPILYMTIVDGWAHTHYGPTGMLNVEAALGIIGVVLFLVLVKFLNSKPAVAQ